MAKPLQPLPLSFWVLSGSFLMGMLAAVDVALEGGGFAAFAWALGAGVFVGALQGVLFGLLFWVLSRAWFWLAMLVWNGLGVAFAVWQIAELGVFERLNGDYQTLALIGLAGSCLGGLGLSLIALSVQPSRGFPQGRIGALSRRFRIIAAALEVVVALACMWADRSFQPGGYPAAHLALQLAGFWLLLFASQEVLPPVIGQLTPSRRRLLAVLLPAVAVVTVALTLKSTHLVSLQRLQEGRYSWFSLQPLRLVSDFDADGYSPWFGGSDCAPFDSQIHPAAIEIPGNGRDENCRLGDAKVRQPPELPSTWPDEPSPTSVVLITVDTVSAQYMSLYGDQHETTPRLDKWSREAAVFEKAYTSGGWTSLAISSMFRGLYPRQLEWTPLFETTHWRLLTEEQLETLRKGEKLKVMFGLPLDDPAPTLAEWLEKRGMYTAAVVSDGSSEFLDPQFQGSGFKKFIDMDHHRRRGHNPTDGAVTKRAIKQLKRLPKTKPFFFWVHYFGPHLGNASHRNIPVFGKDEAARYRHEIAYMDRAVTQLLRRLDRMAKDRPLTVILTSDHGELIKKHSRGHGRHLDEAGIRIPMLIKGKGFKPGRYDYPVSLIDIFPTVAAITGAPSLPLPGRDLSKVVQGDPQANEPRVLLSETWRYSKSGRRLTDQVVAFDGEFKLLADLVSQTKALRDQQNEDVRQNLLGSEDVDPAKFDQAISLHLEYGGGLAEVARE